MYEQRVALRIDGRIPHRRQSAFTGRTYGLGEAQHGKKESDLRAQLENWQQAGRRAAR